MSAALCVGARCVERREHVERRLALVASGPVATKRRAPKAKAPVDLDPAKWTRSAWNHVDLAANCASIADLDDLASVLRALKAMSPDELQELAAKLPDPHRALAPGAERSDGIRRVLEEVEHGPAQHRRWARAFDAPHERWPILVGPAGRVSAEQHARGVFFVLAAERIVPRALCTREQLDALTDWLHEHDPPADRVVAKALVLLGWSKADANNVVRAYARKPRP